MLKQRIIAAKRSDLWATGARHSRMLVFCLVLFVSVFEAHAQPAVREYDVKAAFLFNFCQFVEWPAAALSNTNAPFVIGILGADPFGKFLDDLVRNERAHGRLIVPRRFARVEDALGAHIVFISKSERPRINSILNALKGKPILTVGEAGETEGGMIAFVTERNNIRLRINPGAARSAGLTISARVLRFAEIVRDEKP